MSKVIINAAITGCTISRGDNKNIPITISEIVDCVAQLQDEGVAIVHLHARRSPDICEMSTDPQVYQDLVGSVRSRCPEMIICLSLSGRHTADIEKRCIPLEAKPDMASLTLGSMNFPDAASLNAPETIVALARRIYTSGAIPELEVFEPGFVNYANYLIEKNILSAPFYFNIILGSLGTSPLDLIGLGNMVRTLPPGSLWAVGGIGRFQLDANVMGLASGGHVRVGLEDTVFFDRDRRIVADNLQLVKRIVRIAREMGRPPATPIEARAMIGLESL